MTIEHLEAELNALPDERDIATPRQRDELWQRRQTLTAHINHIRLNMATVERTAPLLEAKKRWREHLVAWRQELTERLIKLTPRDPQFQLVRLSLVRIDTGLDFMQEVLPGHLPIDDLLHAAGFVPQDAFARAKGDAWFGSLVQVEREIRELKKRHDDAKSEVEASLRSAEAALAG
jgi:hypothetical protein